ncbi:MAG: serine/threonine protein kinase, partial [Myxococcales bacterium]|nr:serine/threonine protein kinase [Myxococcales bacterium]
MTGSGLRISTTEPALGSTPPAASEADTLVGNATFVGEGTSARPGSSPDALPLRRGDVVGRYLLIELLGRGAMGRVFSAYDPDLDRRVAIKVVEASSDQLLQEAKAMARIDHPNVIRVYDVGRHGRSMFIAMELVEGVTLERWMRRGADGGKDRPRTRLEILDALIGAARGLAAAHAAGVVHRDFKPANVMMADTGEPKVGDFGLAGFEQAEDDLDGASPMVGTPAYMSPEHFAGTGVDATSDQFSFAIVLSEALHGSRPFRGQTVPELAAKVLSGDLAPEHASGRGRLDAIIRQALSPDPRDRFRSMDDVVAALERIRRPAWPRWTLAASLVAATTAALAWGAAEDPSPCQAGSERIEAIWTPAARAALELRDPTFTKPHLRQIRERFDRALDDYAARWSDAHDRSCAAAGPGGTRGTPAQAAVAQCLENRLGSLRGLIEFSTADPLDASRVDALLETLPSLDDCTSGRWIPYPADPSRASEAAAIDEDLAAIGRARKAGRLEDLDERSKATLEAAEALGEPYPLAQALNERARVFTGLQKLP